MYIGHIYIGHILLFASLTVCIIVGVVAITAVLMSTLKAKKEKSAAGGEPKATLPTATHTPPCTDVSRLNPLPLSARKPPAPPPPPPPRILNH